MYHYGKVWQSHPFGVIASAARQSRKQKIIPFFEIAALRSQ